MIALFAFNKKMDRFGNIFVPHSIIARKVERNVETETKSRERDKFVNKIKNNVEIEVAEAISFKN